MIRVYPARSDRIIGQARRESRPLHLFKGLAGLVGLSVPRLCVAMFLRADPSINERAWSELYSTR